MADPAASGDPVFHLTTPHEWAEAARTGRLAPPSLASEGFVHCSTEHQVPGTIDRHFGGIDELVLLRLDDRVRPELRWEEGRPGEVYPHLYRALTPADVAEVVPWRRG